MNIRIPTNIRFGQATHLAGTVVALACLVALLLPVGAIIIFPAAAPVGMLVTDHILGLPLATTLQVAEESLAPGFNFGSNSFQGLAAGGALYSDLAALPISGFRTDSMLRLPFTVALWATESLFLIVALEFVSAHFTDTNPAASVLWGTLAFPVLVSPLADASTAAKIQFLDPGGADSKYLAALSTLDSRLLFSFPGAIAFPATERSVRPGGKNLKYAIAEFTRLFNSLYSWASHAALPWRYLMTNILYHESPETQNRVVRNA